MPNLIVSYQIGETLSAAFAYPGSTLGDVLTVKRNLILRPKIQFEQNEIFNLNMLKAILKWSRKRGDSTGPHEPVAPVMGAITSEFFVEGNSRV
ncbi:hypothetical protein J2D73_03555 [Acetobacter sacchari]|uniref:Uncharacterized protein n=1 Tax=Acetobacter sacchari TaxID=2661687 RepID=A0ABS3LSI7_9PROT|nr:hypothetical protein [Acetobacter sacchari]MBO1358877.1 hypothetical protein [Acetobacter sacchari]